MTAQEVERMLKARGFRLAASNGSHFKWTDDAGRSVPVPHHGNRPIRQGTLHSIFRLAGIPPPR
ncbi:MAG: type II toxin-antitoxin system HicA family toxin [Kiritimatiellia bacterium]